MPKKTQATFEEALERLEEIVRKMEGGKLTLDDTTALYEEGIKLSTLCKSKLDISRKKVMLLVDDNNTMKEVAFDETDE